MANGHVFFSSVLDPRRSEAFNQDSLHSVQNQTFRISHPKVVYFDNFSTLAAQKETLVMARDPDEYEAALEAVGSNPGTATQEFLQNTLGPHESAPSWQCNVPNGVTLPSSVGIPFPEPPAGRPLSGGRGPISGLPTPSTGITTLQQSEFSGGQRVNLAGPAAAGLGGGGSIKGLYSYNHGLCSGTVDLIKDVVPAVLQANPGEDSFKLGDTGRHLGNVYKSSTDQWMTASFVNIGEEGGLTGGLVLSFVQHIRFGPFGAISADASRNITATFILDNGIFSVSPRTNVSVYNGPFGDFADPIIDQKVRDTFAPTIRLKALEKQARPIPALLTGPECEGGGVKPITCFQKCIGVGDPSQYPKALTADNPDDSSWYTTTFCHPAAVQLGTAARSAAIAAGFPASQADTVVSALTGGNASGGFPDMSPNIRCNFHPSYVLASNGAPPTAVCEVVARAKRLNVFPDQAELVFFDGQSFDHASLFAELQNPALGIYFALRFQATASNPHPETDLCGRLPSALSIRHFAHAAIKPLCAGSPCDPSCGAASSAATAPAAAAANPGSASDGGTLPTPRTCVGARTDDDSLQSVDTIAGTFNGLLFSTPVVPHKYRHTAGTTHVASTAPSTATIPAGPQRPDCDGLAQDWDAKVAKVQRGQSVDSHEWLIALSNMARSNCPAEITVDCASGEPGDALTIQPLATGP